MRKENGIRDQRGFTVIEIMIALLVTTLVIVGSIGGNIFAQRNSEEMHERTIAIKNANRLIEMMRYESRTGTFPANVVTRFPDPDLLGIIPQFNDGITDETPNLSNKTIGVSYCRGTISPCPAADTTANPLDVTVTVSWRSYTGVSRSETIRTYITQR